MLHNLWYHATDEPRQRKEYYITLWYHATSVPLQHCYITAAVNLDYEKVNALSSIVT